MLQKPEWNGPSLGGMIQWLEQQPADGKYEYSDSNECVCAQYYRSIGRSFQNDFRNVPSYFNPPQNGPLNEPTDDYTMARDLNSNVGAGIINTYGGALRRARAVMAKSFADVPA